MPLQREENRHERPDLSDADPAEKRIRDLLRKPARLIYVVFCWPSWFSLCRAAAAHTLQRATGTFVKWWLWRPPCSSLSSFSLSGTASLERGNDFFPSPTNLLPPPFTGPARYSTASCGKSAQHSCWASFSSTNMDGFIISMASPWRPRSRSFYATPQRSFWDKLPP